MKRKVMVMVVLTAAIIGGGTGTVVAGHGPGGGFGGPPRGMGQGMEQGREIFEERMATALKLTYAQQDKIKEIFEAERELVKPLFEKMHENRKLLMQAAEAPVFDEDAVRVLAREQATIEVELIVSRTKVHSQINALLSPEQRELQKNLRPEMK